MTWQYLWLQHSARNEGQPELWFLPSYGFRLVMRNLPRRRTFSGIRYRALLRTRIAADVGASVATLQDTPLIDRDDFFLFPGFDQVLLSFQLEINDRGSLTLIHTDKLGAMIARHSITDESVLVADFVANMENWLNFDITIARRVEIVGARLREIARSITEHPSEGKFEVSRVRTIA